MLDILGLVCLAFISLRRALKTTQEVAQSTRTSDSRAPCLVEGVHERTDFESRVISISHQLMGVVAIRSQPVLDANPTCFIFQCYYISHLGAKARHDRVE